jgi:hypothetical protein
MAAKKPNIIQERRQEKVARLMLQGLSSREIADQLAREEVINPDTGTPWAVETIRLDQKAIQKKWKQSTKESVETHRAQQLAELALVKREAWESKNHGVILTALAHEAKLTDTAAPLRINLSLVSDWWEAIERRGHNPEVVLKAMIAELAAHA